MQDHFEVGDGLGNGQAVVTSHDHIAGHNRTPSTIGSSAVHKFQRGWSIIEFSAMHGFVRGKVTFWSACFRLLALLVALGISIRLQTSGKQAINETF